MVVFDHIAIGFAAVFTAHKLLYCFFGVFMGMLMGVLPGIGAMATLPNSPTTPPPRRPSYRR